MPTAIPGTPYPLRLQLSDGNAAVFPRALVYNEANTLLATVDLAAVTGGLYGGTYTFATEGYFFLVYLVYTDAGHTTLSGAYGKEAEQIEARVALADSVWDALIDSHLTANSMGEAMAIVRGLVQHNYILDNPTYNSKGLLLSGRMRIFKNKADTDAQVNPLVTLTISGTAQVAPNDMLGQVLKVTRDP